VTFLWSTSWVLIKIGLSGIPALTFAALRYGLAFVCLLPFLFRPGEIAALRRLPASSWVRLLALGMLYYTLTQGALFVSLVHLPAVTVSLLYSFSPIFVALLGIPLLAERLTIWQWLGVALSIAGATLYFYPVALPGGELIGFVAVAIGVIANAGSSILGRQINRIGDIPPLGVTSVSMGFGAFVLLSAGIVRNGIPAISLSNWAIIAWLALVNTAFAFTLWNQTLRTLSAVESSVINNTMLIQIAILAWIFLGERLTWQETSGLIVSGLGVVILQLRSSSRVFSWRPKLRV
jgi:drug/metabolite transporter (DMT)-like permease